jgi:SAM-dependent methyltransferase
MLPQLYHAHHSRHLEDLPFWFELAAQTGDPILELGCGTGRVLIPLAQAGFHTIGLDHNLAMLKFVKASIGPQIQPAPMLIVADISRFMLTKQFPLIILPCNTFSTLHENYRHSALECVRKHLKPGGVFAASLPNPEQLKDLPAWSVAEFEDEFIHPQTGNPVQVSSSWRRTKHSFNVTWIYDHLLPDGRVERQTIETAHLMTHEDTYIEEIQSAGMKITGVYGDFNRSAYTADSPQLILVATG